MREINSQPKRLCFRCEGCEINFAKFESLEVHRKSYCIKRLNVSPSSTITKGAIMNINHHTSGVQGDEVTHPFVEELLSSMAIKRSFLETSMKTAMDAQYIIGLHKVAQQEKQIAFRELDEILNWERSLTDASSQEEREHVSAARSHALIIAERAYLEEKYSGDAVEQALIRQRASIEAAIMATSQEQVALIAVLRGFNVTADESSKHLSFQIQDTAPIQSSFAEDKRAVVEAPKQNVAEIVSDVASE